MHVFLICVAVFLTAMLLFTASFAVLAIRDVFKSAHKSTEREEAIGVSAFLTASSGSSLYLLFLVLSFL